MVTPSASPARSHPRRAVTDPLTLIALRTPYGHVRDQGTLVLVEGTGPAVFAAATEAVRGVGHTPIEVSEPARTNVGQLLSKWIVWGGVVAERDLAYDKVTTRRWVRGYLGLVLFALLAVVVGGHLGLEALEDVGAFILFPGLLLLPFIALSHLPVFSSDLVRITLWAPLRLGENVYDPNVVRTFRVSIEAGPARTHNWASKHSAGRSLSGFSPKGGEPRAVQAVIDGLRRYDRRAPLPSLYDAPLRPHAPSKVVRWTRDFVITP